MRYIDFRRKSFSKGTFFKRQGVNYGAVGRFVRNPVQNGSLLKFDNLSNQNRQSGHLRTVHIPIPNLSLCRYQCK